MNLSIFASEYRKTDTSKRSRLNGSAAVVGLSAGALGWSGLALASSDEARLQTVLLPDHYSLQEDGVVVFSLTTGEQMTLSEDQYVILDGGLLLIVDELAQNAMTQLPVMGTLRTELFMEFQPVRSPDGSIVEASDAQPLWTGEEAAPRLFEQVDIQRFELAQNGSEAETQSETNIVSVAAGGLSLAGLSLASGIIGTEPEAAAEEEEPLAPAAPSEYLSNTMFQALTPATARAFTGSAGDSFIGYSSASTTTPDALVDAGKGAGNSATFNMSAGGDNFFVAGNDAASYSGSIAYTGGSGDDSLTFGTYLAYSDGTATFNMSAGGDNSFVAGNHAAIDSGSIAYTGGSGDDSLTFGTYLAEDDGTATFNMSAGGDNSFVAGNNAAGFSGSIAYTGGSGNDSLTFGEDLAYDDGTATFDMSAGGNNTLVADDDAASYSGSIAYTGGSGDDSLTFGDKLAYNNGTATLDLGDDTAADIVTFLGTIGDSGGSVTIQNFNFNHDTIDVPATVTATSAEITDASGDLTWTDIGGSHTIVFEGIGTGGSGVQATSAQLLADII